MEERRQGFLELKEDIKEIKEKQEMILHILNGNGERGLVAKVAEHEDAIMAHKRVLSHAGLSLIGALVVTGVAFLAVKMGIKQQ